MSAAPAMKRPTPEEVEAYAASIGFKVDGGYFVDYWEQRGWFVRPGIPMRSWTAAVRNWQRMDRQRAAGQPQAAARNPADALRAEAAARRLQVIREAADRIVAMRSWLREKKECPWVADPQGEIEDEKAKILDHYGPKGLDDLKAAVLAAERSKR